MKIDVMMTEEIFRRFTTFDLLRRRKMWRSPVIFASIMGFCAVICFLMRHVDGAVFLGSVLLTVGLGMPLFYFVNFALSLRKQILAMGLKQPQKVYSLELTEASDGIRISNQKEKASYFWKDVYQVYRDKTAVYLYMTPARAFLLPYASLKDGDADALWALILSQVAQEKCILLS